MESIREIRAVLAMELRRALKSGRVIVLLALYSMFSLLVLFVVGGVSSKIREGGGVDAAGGAVALRDRLLGFLFSDDPAMLDALRDIPMVVLIVFQAALLFLPLYVAIMGFDQISGEVGPRSMRYLAVRARRSSVLFGKVAAQAVLLWGLLGVVHLAVFAYAGGTDPDFTLRLAIPTGLKFWLASAVFCLAYLGLTAACSTLFRTPAMSLTCNALVLFAFPLLNFLGSVNTASPTEKGPLSYLGYLSPSHYALDLLHPYLSRFGLSAAALAGFVALFLGIAYGVLRERDL